MRRLTTVSKERYRTFLYFYILLALLTLLVAASYTWFSISQTPRVSDMELYINAESGIELTSTYDAEEWGQTIRFPDLISTDTPLKPATWSEERQTFLAAAYGIDGRITDQWQVLTDSGNANRSDSEGYYVLGTFYARSSLNCQVSLGEAVEVNEGENGAGTYVIGTPLWDSQNVIHEDGGSGAETAIRLGFRITPIDSETGEATGASSFYIYEPNCDAHADAHADSDADEDIGYVPTASIDGRDTLSDNLILQSASSWSEAYPIQREVTVKTLGQFLTPTTLFSLEAGEKVRIDLYVWLEGQDIDCTNEIEEAQIFANIQFSVEYENKGGLEEIPQ